MNESQNDTGQKKRLSTSEIKSFKKCRAYWYWENSQMITPKVIKAPYLTGSATHKGIEAIYGDSTVDEAIKEVESYYTQYLKGEGVLALLGESQLLDLEKQRQIAIAMVGGYYSFVKTYGGDYGWKVLVTEEKFNLPFTNPASGRKSQFFTMCGTLDLVVEIPKSMCPAKRGGIWLVEHKTSGDVGPAYFSKLRFDFQVSAYLWALSELLGEVPVGCIYNVIRKPGIKQTKKEKTKEEFYKRQREDLKTRTDFYYHRKMLFRNPDEIKAFEQELYNISKEIREAKYFYSNEFACNLYGTCQYLPLCSSQSQEELEDQLKLFRAKEERYGDFVT